MIKRPFVLVSTALIALASLPAAAIPSFARKYGTSCMTCHTVYPKLTPFGEAFRRDGFRFPGIDSDYAKQETVTTKAKTPGSEPAWISAIPPLSIGFNGQALLHPDKNAAGTSNQTQFDLSGLAAEGHVWAGGTFSDTVSYFGEVTIAANGSSLEHAQVYLNDLIGPAHAVNLRVGRGFSNVSSFGAHSSFLADALLPPTRVTAMNGGANGWSIGDHYNGVELSGVVAAGRVDYNLGWNAGSSFDLRPSEDVYGHLGVKLGGMRLDGEGKSEANAERPWEETAVTLDLFGYHSYGSVKFPGAGAATSSTFTTSNGTDTVTFPGPNDDLYLLNTINTVGGGVRAQLGSFELSAGLMLENHKHAESGGSSATLLTQYSELSYIVFPWLVPAVRFEYNRLSPDSSKTGCQIQNAAEDGTTSTSACPSVNDWRLWPGVALAPYPNIKLVLTALFEGSSGNPATNLGAGSWGPAGGFGPPPSGSGTLFQNVQLFAAVAY